jgi:hypothetical protein
MTETTRHGSLGQGDRLNSIHTHQQRNLLKWPWLLLGLLALLLAAWALRRHPTRNNQRNDQNYVPSHETQNNNPSQNYAPGQGTTTQPGAAPGTTNENR